MVNKEVIEDLKNKFNLVRSKKELLEQVIEEKKKEREIKAQELIENGIDVESDLALEREELGNKVNELTNKLSSELSIWESKLDEIKKDLFK